LGVRVEIGMDRGERIGLNEAVFREVNERINDLAENFGLEDQPLDLVCECGDPNCVERISMSRTDYEQLRSEPTHFAVHAGHVQPDVEDVVDRRSSYLVVRKREGDPAEVARETDPRS
jgi:hypothetical protein